MRSGRRPINVERAIELYARGISLAEVGRRLAAEEGRPVPYKNTSIDKAIRRRDLGRPRG